MPRGDIVDITRTIENMKQQPGFTENVGMILVHNGVVRGWSRNDRSTVRAVTVTPDSGRIDELCREYRKKPGIFDIRAEAMGGTLKPGDDLLYIVVAGDIRENVKPVLSELLDRIKSEAVTKHEQTL
jgi:molybdopterin synthase catalytic subunit